MEWLKQHPDTSSQPEMGDTSALNLLETLQVKHIVTESSTSRLFTSFDVSQLSGSIAIASQLAKPPFSVMYPGTNKFPLTLSSSENLYTSILFITISGQEYLAAARRDGIHLWNPAQKAKSVVYKFKESGHWHMCEINERTLACVSGQKPSPDGFVKVYVLNTDSEKFNLSGTLHVKAAETITHMCYVRKSDGTSCFLLNSTLGHLVQCVEMVGGKVQWQVDEQQIGESFCSWNICTDGSTVFVADASRIKLHLVSAEDGSVLTSISLQPYGISLSGFICLQGEHLYIGHVIDKLTAYCISKFVKPNAVSDIEI